MRNNRPVLFWRRNKTDCSSDAAFDRRYCRRHVLMLIDDAAALPEPSTSLQQAFNKPPPSSASLRRSASELHKRKGEHSVDTYKLAADDAASPCKQMPLPDLRGTATTTAHVFRAGQDVPRRSIARGKVYEMAPQDKVRPPVRYGIECLRNERYCVADREPSDARSQTRDLFKNGGRAKGRASTSGKCATRRNKKTSQYETCKDFIQPSNAPRSIRGRHNKHRSLTSGPTSMEWLLDVHPPNLCK